MIRQTILTLILAGTLMPLSRALAVEIVAHRGASHDAPENTLPAAKLGWERNADAVEVDIYLTRDGKIAVIHDDNTKRTAGVDKRIDEQTLAELKSLDAGSWKGQQWAGTRIPALDEVLAAIPSGKRLFIEIKCGPEVLPELEAALDRSGKHAQVVIISFGYPVVEQAKKRFRTIPVYWLYGFSEREKKGYGDPSLGDLIAKAKAAGLDGLDVNFRGPFGKEFVEQLSAEGMKLYVYTVNESADASRLAEIGVAGITTDRPAYLRETLAGR
ncbi:MAG: glycerophosphodiester phosphodiesterase [Bryobacterales bacterium]